jgi:hypothetical protein
MSRRLVVVAALAVLAAAPARADGPQASPAVMQGWTGVTAPGAPFRYVTLPTRHDTVLAMVRRSTGRVWGFRTYHGTWGVPQVANDGTAGGLSRDGRLLVLAAWNPYGGFPKTSRFLLVSTRSMKIIRRVAIKGNFGFDALSPGARYLYLIEHVSTTDLTRYRVRAYDFATGRLLPRVIADRRQASWTMSGYPVTRAADADGRFVYTLYQGPDGAPFVHALDAAARTAVCVGIPWRGSNYDIVYSLKLRLEPRAHALMLETRRGQALWSIDTKTYWVSRPDASRRSAGLLSTARALLR